MDPRGLSPYLMVGAVFLALFLLVFVPVDVITAIDARSDLLRGNQSGRIILSGVLQVGMGIAAAGWVNRAMRILCPRPVVPTELIVVGVFFTPLTLFLPAFFSFDYMLRKLGLPRGIGFAFLATGLTGLVSSFLVLSVFAGSASWGLLSAISGTLTQVALVLGWVIGRQVTQKLQSSAAT